MKEYNIWMMTYHFIEIVGKGEGKTGVMIRCFDREMQFCTRPGSKTVLGCLNTLMVETTDFYEKKVIQHCIDRVQW